ncbi:type IV pilin [Halovenus halobia]|uniref:type IV pilin n=1 Tax=Halovenus halobia TaxID=3396622 RepID=UPI003F5429AA
MKLKQLLTDDDAVSPVIGVILMVAITVILAAVIATFVLGLGEQVSDTAPNANFQFDYNDSVSVGANENVTITHTSGPAIEASTLSVGGPGVNSSVGFTETRIDQFGPNDEISAGDSLTVVGNGTYPEDVTFTNGETVSVIWSSEGDSATLANYEIPS